MAPRLIYTRIDAFYESILYSINLKRKREQRVMQSVCKELKKNLEKIFATHLLAIERHVVVINHQIVHQRLKFFRIHVAGIH